MAFPSTCWNAEAWRRDHQTCIALWHLVDIEVLQYDLMHSKYLGVDAYYAASIMLYIVEWKLTGEATENMKTLWNAIKLAYQQLKSPSQFSVINLNMIRPGSSPFPCLRGKAAEIKHLIPALERVASQFLDKSHMTEGLMIKGLQMSRAIDGCLQEAGRAPRPDPCNEGKLSEPEGAWVPITPKQRHTHCICTT